MRVIGPIEKDVPIPKAKGGHDKQRPCVPEYLYPWRSMQVGDSFLVKGITQRHMTATMNLDAKKHNRKYTSRVINDQCVRVWRIK